MTLIDLGPIAAEPVPLADLKRWCRIDRNDEDELLGALAKAAREAIEADTRQVLVRRSFRLSLDSVPADGWIRIDRHPLVSVTSVTAYDVAGNPTSFGTADRVIERVAGVEAVRVSPAVRAKAANGLEIEFVAGFAAAEVPEALRMAIRRIVSASYELRGVVAVSQQPGFVPPAARALIAPFRRVGL